MIIQKSLKVPIHYDTTKTKLDILDKLTARIAFGIRLISELITEETKIDRKTIRGLVKDSDIVTKTGLSAGFVQQCIDKYIWTRKSYQKLHRTWERQAASAEKRIVASRDYTEKEKRQKSFDKILKREPSLPDFRDKTPCRIDYRIGKIQRSESKLTPLWMHISTLKKNQTIDVPLNPSQYHLNQLSNAEINDFPREEQLLDSAKRELLEKYDYIVASLQEAEKWDKLRQLRNKRENVSVYHDWCLANQVAEFTEGSYVVIGNSRFRQTQVRGNGNPTLRKRVGKWSYGRQRKYIAFKRAERGYPTELRDERNTSKKCHECNSMLTTRKWGNGHSYILCHSCGAKIDADINAGYNIATQCRDDWLKAGMNMENIYASL